MSERIVVIGAGQAAASFVAKLRAMGSTAQVTIIGDEESYPYQRPPLSKKYLLGEMEVERLLLRPHSWYGENAAEVRTGVRAEEIDRNAKVVKLSNGEIAYDKLLLATGSRPRELPETMTKNAPNMFTVRNLDDVERMRGAFQDGRNLVVIGGGYIGLEAAAVARKFGCNVTVIEAAPRILGRVACKETADVVRALHLENGVDIVEGAGIKSFGFDGEKMTSVELEDGRLIDLDFAIAGIGILTNSELAEQAGLECDQGILVDAFCRTNDADIYAAGDCARFDYQGQLIRLESVQNAIDQGEAVAINMMDEAQAYAPKPWFWSDQYDMSLQIAGLNLGYDDVVVRGEDGVISHWYYRGDQLISVDAINAPRAYMVAKRILGAGNSVPKDVAFDASADLKPFMR